MAENIYQCTYPGCRHTETYPGLRKGLKNFQPRHQHINERGEAAYVEMRRVREVPSGYTDSLVGDKRSTKQYRE